jgi:phosphoribosylglycinamide formyltransferase-1
MQNIVILISGAGSNMAAILRAAERGQWEQRYSAKVAAVISNRADAKGLELAAQHGVPTQVVDHRAHASRDAFDHALAQCIAGYEAPGHPTWVVMAGFMRVLTPAFTERFAGRLVNIHPSLLPAFPGLHTHQRAIEAGCKFAGATVHLVTADLDKGPILAQAVAPVLATDTADTLAARVLALEHQIYPRALAALLAQHAPR